LVISALRVVSKLREIGVCGTHTRFYIRSCSKASHFSPLD
jgi:hypothetical protein